jgi:hypothetical protein
MRTIVKVISGIFLLVILYFIVTDGMITYFKLSRSIQYAFNFASIFILIPFGLYFLLGMNVEETR